MAIIRATPTISPAAAAGILIFLKECLFVAHSSVTIYLPVIADCISRLHPGNDDDGCIWHDGDTNGPVHGEYGNVAHGWPVS